MSSRAADSDAEVLGLLNTVDQLEVLRARNLGANTVLEVLTSRAGLDTLSVNEGETD